MTLETVLRRRLATQRLSAAPLPTAADAVRLLLCVQAQDAPLAAFSLGERSRTAGYAGVLAEQAAGGWVRTHILRPTWHLVAPEDLRWVQRLTGPKVERSMPQRHRLLGLDDAAFTAAIALLERLLAGPTPRTRRELSAAFAEHGLPARGEQMAHQLMAAELRAVICSGPPRGVEHTYVLVDETVPPHPNDALTGADARRELVRRFVLGHGPVADRDLARWCSLSLTEIRAALAELGEAVSATEVGGIRLWSDAVGAPPRATRSRPAYLLSTFDEAALSYIATGFPRVGPTVDRSRLVGEAGGGIVVLGTDDIGVWKRRVLKGRVEVRVRPEVAALTGIQREAIEGAAQRLADFLDLPLDLAVE